MNNNIVIVLLLLTVFNLTVMICTVNSYYWQYVPYVDPTTRSMITISELCYVMGLKIHFYNTHHYVEL